MFIFIANIFVFLKMWTFDYRLKLINNISGTFNNIYFVQTQNWPIKYLTIFVNDLNKRNRKYKNKHIYMLQMLEAILWLLCCVYLQTQWWNNKIGAFKMDIKKVSLHKKRQQMTTFVCFFRHPWQNNKLQELDSLFQLT